MARKSSKDRIFLQKDNIESFQDLLQELTRAEQEALQPLINNLSFLGEELERLQQTIRNKGFTSGSGGANQLNCEIVLYMQMLEELEAGYKILADMRCDNNGK